MPRPALTWDGLARDLMKAYDAVAKQYTAEERSGGPSMEVCALLVVAKRIDELECALETELDFIGGQTERIGDRT